MRWHNLLAPLLLLRLNNLQQQQQQQKRKRQRLVRRVSADLYLGSASTIYIVFYSAKSGDLGLILGLSLGLGIPVLLTVSVIGYLSLRKRRSGHVIINNGDIMLKERSSSSTSSVIRYIF